MSDETILVIEDEEIHRKLIQLLLGRAGYDVHMVINADEAFEKLKTLHPQLILMDIQLPGMDGLQLTRRLKAEPITREIIIVALTAYALKGSDQEALAAGCDGYISKPIEKPTFLNAVRKYLDRDYLVYAEMIDHQSPAQTGDN
jgi:two-component system, cell cycle response regulator DivK